MKQFVFHTTILLICFFGISRDIMAQSKTELENRRRKTQEEIKYTNDLLQKTQRDRKMSLNQLIILNKKISSRQDLIKNITEEVNTLDNSISEKQVTISTLQTNLKKLIAEYSKMVRIAYKTQSSYNEIIFLLSANDFNMAYRRLRYMQLYADYRKKQMGRIKKTSHELWEHVNDLMDKKQVKENLLSEEKQETNQLTSEKLEKDKIVSGLKSREQELRRKLTEQKQADLKLKQAINEIISEEIRKAEIARKEKMRKEKLLAEKNKTVHAPAEVPVKAPEMKKEPVFDLTPSEQIVSDNFVLNKGKLPWPIERGVVTGTFGEHEHPVLKGIKVKNDGIYISTTRGSTARCVFEGTVSKIISIPGKNKAVIIRHGDFLTVYSNLISVSVNIGDRVKTKQKIGTVYTDDDDDGKTVLELQIWHGTLKQDPESWLSSSN